MVLQLDASQKIQVREYMLQHPTASNNAIVRHFQGKFNVSKISKDQIRRIRQQSVEDLKANAKTLGKQKRQKHARWPELETALCCRVIKANAAHVAINNLILYEEACKLDDKFLDIGQHPSQCWLYKLRQRNQLSYKQIAGEAGSVSNKQYNIALANAQQLVQRYELKDVWNFDESRLYYRFQYHKTKTVQAQISGGKKEKARITVVPVCNALGTEKRKLIVINNAALARSFCADRDFNVNDLVSYYNNKTAWMTSEMFTQYCMEWNKQLKDQDRMILLLLDNASCHKLMDGVTLSNITLAFFDPNVMSCLQPLDQGIIATFKLYYKKKLSQFLRDYINSLPDEFQQDAKATQQVTIKIVIEWAKWAWDKVLVQTIAGCWAHSKIYTQEQLGLTATEQVEAQSALQAQVNDLASTIGVSAIESEQYAFENTLTLEIIGSATDMLLPENDDLVDAT